jgi:hypothetical protein
MKVFENSYGRGGHGGPPLQRPTGDGTGLLLYTGRKTSVAMRSTCAGKVQVRLVMNLGSKVA